MNKHYKKFNNFIPMTLVLLILTNTAQSSSVNIPHLFAANTPAVADQVNQNFTAVKSSVDDNDTKITNINNTIALLLSAVNQLQMDLATANATIDGLTNDLAAANTELMSQDSRIASIEGNTVLGLDGFLMLSSLNGYDTAEFTGINVQINNGIGYTERTVNGLGNLIIGYNESDPRSRFFCSLEVHNNEVDCLANGGIWANNVRGGSHNLILGHANSYDDFSSIITGQFNISNNISASVIGGTTNLASGYGSSILGGSTNTASAGNSTVSGGSSNTASGSTSSVSGGSGHTSSGADDWRAGSLFQDQ